MEGTTKAEDDRPSIRRSFSRTGSQQSLDIAIKDPDSTLFDANLSHSPGVGFWGYLPLCLVTTLLISGTAIGLWADMGCGQVCIDFLADQRRFALIFGGIGLFLTVILYMLDFFWPPHLPGMFLALHERDWWLGRSLFTIAVLAFLATLLLLTGDNPALLLIVTVFGCPAGVIGLRKLTAPTTLFFSRTSSGGVEAPDSFRERMRLLNMLIGAEVDQKAFYKAAMYAFLGAALACVVAWIPWAVRTRKIHEIEVDATKDTADRELLMIRWAAPLIVAMTNVAFASFVFLRVLLNDSYTATDKAKNNLIVHQGAPGRLHQDLLEHRLAMVHAHLCDGNAAPEDRLKATEDRTQKYLIQHITHMKQLTAIVKTVGCCFIAVLGSLYVGFQLTLADSPIARMVQTAFCFLLLTFVAFVSVAFDRLWKAIGVWLQDLPMWKAAASACRADWARALFICLALPSAPFVLLISWINQLVRRCRRLAVNKDCFTQRVAEVLQSFAAWEWIHVIYWCYVFAMVMIIYKAVPVFLNVLLSWMTEVMKDLGFGPILLATYAIGMILFMLPPVPGPPIYLFGGFVISEKCPWGFWWGTLISIVLSFFLKLSACFVQQKLIGERLGQKMYVKQIVGVHKPLIRAIEVVLSQPGLSFGKCMILCGGPDWPTSVLAGILRLSVLQCMLGTTPVLASVMPLCLTGSFFLRRSESDFWLRAGNLTFTLTLIVSVIFWVGMGWAIQSAYDKSNWEINRPREEFVALEWLDYRADVIKERCGLHWADLPLLVKVLYAGGALIATVCGQIVFWRSNLCFGTFRLIDDINELRWFGQTGLVRPLAIVTVTLAMMSYAGLFTFKIWVWRRNKKVIAEAAAELEILKPAWIVNRLTEARSAAQSPKAKSLPSIP
mmetsp:Transcript_8894/g.19553  ORF Transcript_8894/g.19553 Transcript_8894/m.19553 type:complete len:892 (+) Transcript_8894:41-2716(+)